MLDSFRLQLLVDNIYNINKLRTLTPLTLPMLRNILKYVPKLYQREKERVDKILLKKK